MHGEHSTSNVNKSPLTAICRSRWMINRPVTDLGRRRTQALPVQVRAQVLDLIETGRPVVEIAADCGDRSATGRSWSPPAPPKLVCEF